MLFVGNSLTCVNDLPRMVKALADSAGVRAAWARDPSQALYAPDGLHASVSGTRRAR